MIRLVLRQILGERARAIFTILAVAVVITEILVLEGFLAGLYTQLREMVLSRGGDLFVSQAGITNFTAARSILPQVTRLEVEKVPGVRAAHPITAISVIFERDGRRTPIILLVYDSAGGPTRVTEGSSKPSKRGIVIDRALATKYGLRPGSPLEVSDFRFEVTGIAERNSAFLTPFAFITYDDLIDFYFESDVAADIATFPILSFLLIDVAPGVAPAEVARRIEKAIPVADVHRPADLARNDENLGRELLGPILGLMLAVSYLVGALVVGTFLFAAVRARRPVLGVLKALGFATRRLGFAVLLETVILVAAALPLGIAIAWALSFLIEDVAPIYLVQTTEPAAILKTSAAAMAFACLGAWLPVRAIARIDPADVFRR